LIAAAIVKGAAATPPFCFARMIPKSGNRFSDQIMRNIRKFCDD